MIEKLLTAIVVVVGLLVIVSLGINVYEKVW